MLSFYSEWVNFNKWIISLISHIPKVGYSAFQNSGARDQVHRFQPCSSSNTDVVLCSHYESIFRWFTALTKKFVECIYEMYSRLIWLYINKNTNMKVTFDNKQISIVIWALDTSYFCYLSWGCCCISDQVMCIVKYNAK